MKIPHRFGPGHYATPQFTRPADDPQPIRCPDRETLEALPMMSPGELRELGLRPWNDPDDSESVFAGKGTLWLLPGEWYQDLPDGLRLTSIMGLAEIFERGVTSDDIRFGCLAYGILVPL
jgi:hypothetical protein